MGLFSSKFSKLLEADNTESQPTPQTDKEAMAQQLDTAAPDDLGANAPAQIERQKQVDQVKIQQIGQLKNWIGQIDQFVTFLNGTEQGSIQTDLHSAPCDTVFENIARSEKKKIARLAAELSTLSESFKGYLISFNDQ
jgi:hypothetical protein